MSQRPASPVEANGLDFRGSVFGREALNGGDNERADEVGVGLGYEIVSDIRDKALALAGGDNERVDEIGAGLGYEIVSDIRDIREAGALVGKDDDDGIGGTKLDRNGSE